MYRKPLTNVVRGEAGKYTSHDKPRPPVDAKAAAEALLKALLDLPPGVFDRPVFVKVRGPMADLRKAMK